MLQPACGASLPNLGALLESTKSLLVTLLNYPPQSGSLTPNKPTIATVVVKIEFTFRNRTMFVLRLFYGPFHSYAICPYYGC